MTLLTLPNELILRIAEDLPNNCDISALSRCNRHLRSQLYVFLYRHRDNGFHLAAPWAISANYLPTLRCIEEAGLSLADTGQDILHKAAGLGHVDLVRYMLNGNQFDIESWETGGRTPLIIAAEKGHKAVVQLLLDHGADPSGPSQPSWLTFPLHAATHKDSVEVATLLATSGANISARDQVAYTPLLWAASRGVPELVDLYLDMGADIHAVGHDRDGVLEQAVQMAVDADTAELLLSRGAVMSAKLGAELLQAEVRLNHSGMVKVLAKYGANINPKDERQRWYDVPLMVALTEGYFSVVESLVQGGANTNVRDDEGNTALHHATDSLHIPSAKLLIDSGADVSLVNKDGNLAMMLTGCPEIVAMMLEKGAPVHHTNKEGCTPLIRAAISDSAEITKILLAAGAKVDPVNKDGWTALHTAVDNDNLQIAELVLEAGGDPRDKRSGHYALNAACRLKDPAMAELLLKYGADISAICCDGMTAVYAAAHSGCLEVVRCLIRHGADINALADYEWSPLLAATCSGHFKMVKLLLENGAHLEHFHANGYTPLLEAVASGFADIVDLLLSNGARVDAITQTGAGSTALSVSAAQGDCKTLERLLEAAEWDVNRTDLYGRTALFQAAMRGHCAIVERLLAHDPPPDLHIKDNWGATALFAAARNGHSEIVQRLFDTGGYSAEKLREQDATGRMVFPWAVQSTESVPRTLLGIAAAMGIDMTEVEMVGEEEAALLFDTKYCYCDICGRCSTCSTDKPVKQCATCEMDGGSALIICYYCIDAGLGCLDRQHTWEVHDNCSCHEQDDSDITDESEHEEDVEENSDGTQGNYDSEAWNSDWGQESGEELEDRDGAHDDDDHVSLS